MWAEENNIFLSICWRCAVAASLLLSEMILFTLNQTFEYIKYIRSVCNMKLKAWRFCPFCFSLHFILLPRRRHRFRVLEPLSARRVVVAFLFLILLLQFVAVVVAVLLFFSVRCIVVNGNRFTLWCNIHTHNIVNKIPSYSVFIHHFIISSLSFSFLFRFHFIIFVSFLSFFLFLFIHFYHHFWPILY